MGRFIYCARAAWPAFSSTACAPLRLTLDSFAPLQTIWRKVIENIAYFGISSFGTRSQRDSPSKSSEVRLCACILIDDDSIDRPGCFVVQSCSDRYSVSGTDRDLTCSPHTTVHAGCCFRSDGAQAPLAAERSYEGATEYSGACNISGPVEPQEPFRLPRRWLPGSAS